MVTARHGGAMLLVIAATAAAQPTARPGDPRFERGFLRVEPGEADVNPLAYSARDLGVDLRLPDGFVDLFQIREDAGGPLAGRFVRVEGGGGILAVFPRGRYVETTRGLFAEVPPGTVYYIGGIPMSAWEASLGSPGSSSAISTRIDTRLGPEVDQRAEPVFEAAPGWPMVEVGHTGDARQRELDARAGDQVARLFTDDHHRGRVAEALALGR